MAIEFVGGNTAGKLGATSGNTTIALNSGLTGGIASAVSAGDLVIAVFGTGATADRTLSITDGTTEYTQFGTEQFSDDTFDTNLRVAYKFMGGTPDTATTFGPTGNAADAGAMAVYVFRGVAATVNDVAVTVATGIDTSRANPPSILPVTAGAFPVCVGAAAHNGGVDTFTSSDLTDFMTNGGANDTNDVTIGIGHIDNWTSGAFDAAAFGHSQADSTSFSWAAKSIALKPAASIVADAGSYTLTGTAATPKHGWKIAPVAGSYALTGTTADLVHGKGEFSRAFSNAFDIGEGTAGAYSIVADAGSYALTGTAATLKHGWKTAADAGSYTLTGTDATLRRNLPLVADAGAYALTGTAASLFHGWRVAADAGSYTLSGTAASLLHAWKLAADAGSYTLTGTDAALKHGWRVAADAGSYSLSGTDATLRQARKVVPDAGSYELTGTDATAKHGRKLVPDAGSYELTGTDATLTLSGAPTAYTIVADPGSYALTGTAASLVVARKIAPDAGAYSLTGTAATLTYVPGAVEVRHRGGDDGGYIRQRRKFRHATARQLQELLETKEEPPPPTHKRLRKVKREIVARIEAAGLLGPARPAVARFVEQELVRAYVPDMDWAALRDAVANVMRKAAEEAARIEQEIEDEDEFLILMAA